MHATSYRLWILAAAVVGLAGCNAGATKTSADGAPAAVAAASPAAAISDQDVSDAYVYLLGRLIVARQEQLDFQEGFVWNQLVHRKPGAVVWPNPNLDVAYSEAWVAIDEKSCAMVSVPKITGRYYTCLLYTSPSPRDTERSRMPSSA